MYHIEYQFTDNPVIYSIENVRENELDGFISGLVMMGCKILNVYTEA